MNDSWHTTELIKWDKRFFSLAKFYSVWGKDVSTKCGAVITRGKDQVSEGYNGFPKGTLDSAEYLENRDIKLLRILHAEMNAILKAGKKGAALEGCTIYVYPFTPCSNCMAAIIQSGIVRVVTKRPTGTLLIRWKDTNEEAIKMANEAGITVDYFEENSCGEV